MWLSITKPFQTFYQVLLILATLGLTFYCIHKYNLDHSLSLVDFKRFHYSKKDLYPSISLCFSDSISNDKLTSKYEGRKKTIYKSYLSGYILDEYLNKEYLEIEFEKVAIKSDEFINGVEIKLGNGTRMIHKSSQAYTWISNKNQPNQKLNWTPVIKTKNIGPLKRCFTLDSPYIGKQAIDYVVISLNKSVFQSGFLNRFHTIVSYPNQILRSGFTSKSDWKELFNGNDMNKDITLQINVENMRVINYRNKPDNPCHADWLNDDQKIYEQMYQEIGCHAPYLDGEDNKCIGQIKMINWSDTLTRFHHTPSSMDIFPCRVIRNLRYSPKIDVREGYQKDLISVAVRYPEYYMEIEHIKEYTLEGLVGNAGGYLGLFLGYALLELPQFVILAYTTIKAVILRVFGSGRKYREHEMEKSVEQTEGEKHNLDELRIVSEVALLKEQFNSLRYDVAVLKRTYLEH